MKRRKVLAALAAVVVIPLVPMSAAAADVPDPLAPGPHRVVETAYTLGDTAFQPPNFPGPVELTGQAYYPADVERGPYPTVVLLHGRHAPCYIASPPAARGGWPCEQGALPIPSHLGYGELGRSLAGHGFAVISISANGINAADALDPANGQPARGELVLAHLDLLRRKDINRFAGPIFPGAPLLNDLGGTVTFGGNLAVRTCGGSATGVGPSCLRWQQDNRAREPHRGYGFGGVRSQTMSWTSTSDTLVNAIPEQHGDARGYKAVQFRAGVDFTSELNRPGAAQDLRVTITDADGKTASAKAGQFGTGLEYPPTTVDPSDVIPHLMLNQVRIPLSAFAGVDLAFTD